jgi:hypothetical protein
MDNYENELDNIRVKLYEETNNMKKDEIIGMVNTHAKKNCTGIWDTHGKRNG